MNGLGTLSWGMTGPDVLWIGVQASFLVLMAGAAALGLRRLPAAGRHGVWSVALFGILALPALPSISPVQVPLGIAQVLATVADPSTTGGDEDVAAPMMDDAREPAVIATSRAGRAGGDDTAVRRAVESTASAPGQGSGAENGTPQSVRSHLAPLWSGDLSSAFLLGIFWLAGTLALVGRFAVGALLLGRLIRGGSAPAPRMVAMAERIRSIMSLKRPVRLVVHERVASPMTWGVIRPVVLLPPVSDAWDEGRLRVVLTHEFAHIARLDVLTRFVAAVTRALHWFNPLVWWAATRLTAEAERACDDIVLRQGERPSEYADHLLALAARAGGRSTLVAAASPMAQRAGFEGRILRVLTDAPRGRFGPIAGGAIVAVGASLVLLIGSVVPGAAAETAPARPVGALEEVPAAGPESGPAVVRAGGSVPEPAPESTAPRPEEAVAARAAEASEAPGNSVAPETAAQEAGSGVAAVDRMIRALSDSDVEVRASIVLALARQEDPRAIQALIEALRTDPDEGVRESVAWALGQFESREAVPALVEALRGDDSVGVEDRDVGPWPD